MNHVPDRSLGVWERSLSWLTDHLIVMIITWPIFLVLYGLDLSGLGLVSFLYILFSCLYTLYFWSFRSTSLGKIAFSAHIIDQESGHAPTFKQYLIRYCGSWISLICFGLGFIWIKIDTQGRSWHDRWSGTRVVTTRSTSQK